MPASRCLQVALGAVAAVLLFAAGAQAQAPPTWSSVKVQAISPGVPWTEPRITTGPDGTLWVVTNGEGPSETAGGGEENSAPAIVLFSTDGGNTWHKTETDPSGQTVATPDVDIATLPNGRVISSELDDAGINFPSAVTDDRGKTWKQSVGSNTLADQDRQWLAAGPNPSNGKERVYLLFHNLASGNANHNMFVAPSDDGGETWGVPVPITLPGDDAYSDLQCADSGGPSTIFVNQRDGTVYAEFTTRGTPIQGVGDLGGCATPFAGQPLEFNIVAGTRIWFAQSKDGGQTWTKSLPVDDAATGQIVSMQVAYAGLDSKGNVYVAYPESPEGKKYPDYSGAGVKYKWAKPADDAAKLDWSDARTFEPADANAPGHVLVHMTVGDPGRIMAAYWEGTARSGQKPVWHMKSAQTLDGLSANPTVTHSQISDVAADTGDASELMGACMDTGPVSGIINGLACDRSPDVWGVTLDRKCGTHIVWPAVDQSPAAQSEPERQATDSDPGTWVSNQTGGSSLCAAGAGGPGTGNGPPPANGVPTAGGGQALRCPDKKPPHSVINTSIERPRSLTFKGRSRDRGCTSANGLHAAAGVGKVQVSIARVHGKHGHGCRFVKHNGRLTKVRNCRHPVLLRASGTRHWKLTQKVRLRPGSYRVVVRGTDRVGNKEKPARYNHQLFSVERKG
jgi:hypothetical protein